MAPSLATCVNWPTNAFRRNPGKPSYQMAANSCCTFGWATNWKNNGHFKNIFEFELIRNWLLPFSVCIWWPISSVPTSVDRQAPKCPIQVPDYSLALLPVRAMFGNGQAKMWKNAAHPFAFPATTNSSHKMATECIEKSLFGTGKNKN